MASSDTARRRARMPAGASRILDSRSLASAHRHLAGILRPGQRVLDVGCGTGAITRHIAEAVAPCGFVAGMDSNARLIQEARRRHLEIANLRFAMADILDLPCAGAFDIVTAARVLQWLAEPQRALQAMCQAARPGGRVVVLDYNHEKVRWVPAPPVSVQRFYMAFLNWRAEAGMDNAMADHLVPMFRAAGLTNIRETPQHESATRGEPGFAARIGLWAEVIATRGFQMVTDGVIREDQRATAEAQYRDWALSEAESHTLHLLAVEGVLTQEAQPALMAAST